MAGAWPSLHAAPQKMAFHPFSPSYLFFSIFFSFSVLSFPLFCFTQLIHSLPTPISARSGCISASSCFTVSQDGE